MTALLWLIPAALVLGAMGLLGFFWAMKSGQYDDLDGPAHRILYDDDKDMIPDDARQNKPNKAESPEDNPDRS